MLTPGEDKGPVLVDVPHSKSLSFPLLCISFAELRNSHPWVKRRKKKKKRIKVRTLRGAVPIPSTCTKQEMHTPTGPARISRTSHHGVQQSNTFIYSFSSSTLWKLACANSSHVLSYFACLPPSAARFLFLGSNQPGVRSTFFRESPAKIPTACSGCISDQLPFHLSPPPWNTKEWFTCRCCCISIIIKHLFLSVRGAVRELLQVHTHPKTPTHFCKRHLY